MEHEDVRARLEEELTCSVCLGVYQDPRKLQCSHTFCLPCLDQILSSSSSASRTTLKCPECRAESSVSRSGARSLPVDRTVARVLNVLESSTTRSASSSAERREVPVASNPVLSGPRLVNEHDPSPRRTWRTAATGNLTASFREALCWADSVLVPSHQNRSKQLIAERFDSWIRSRWFLPRHAAEGGAIMLQEMSLLLIPMWFAEARVTVDFNAVTPVFTRPRAEQGTAEHSEHLVQHCGQHEASAKVLTPGFRFSSSTQNLHLFKLLECLGADGAGFSRRQRELMRSASNRLRGPFEADASADALLSRAPFDVSAENVNAATQSAVSPTVPRYEASRKMEQIALSEVVEQLSERLRQRSSLTEFLSHVDEEPVRLGEARVSVGNSIVDMINFERVLVPIWTLVYASGSGSERCEHRVYINAVTGDIAGTRPWDVRSVSRGLVLAACGVGILLAGAAALRGAAELWNRSSDA
mmetsp:Transcript_632/g.1651  ORF Transcript_632/g.1651 Transcript_632/m.1651 type:complete len:472 (-) Transcript_632:121-1536(-)